MTQEPTIQFCVGATKSGTSWLFEYLSDHPESHVRSIKELHYFDTLETGAFQQQIALHRNKAARLRGRLAVAKGNAQRRTSAKMQDVKHWNKVLKDRVENTANYLAYLTWGMDKQALVADITPAYALLPVKRLKEMAKLSSDTRFIYLMRDPVARLWSHVRMIERRAEAAAGVAARDMAAACKATMDRVISGVQSAMTERGDYKGAIERLNAAVDPSKLLIMFMEEMLTPAGIARLCAFLGIAYRQANFDQPVHVGPVLAMAPAQYDAARALLRPQYDFVARHYPDIPANWRKSMGEGL